MEITRYWRFQSVRYGTPNGGLRGSMCEEGHIHFPPRDVCPECAMIAYHGWSGLGEEQEQSFDQEQVFPVVLLREAELATLKA